MRHERAIERRVARSNPSTHFLARVGNRVLFIEYDRAKWLNPSYLKVDTYLAGNPDTYAIVKLSHDEKMFVEQLIGEHVRTGKIPARFAVESSRRNPMRRSNPGHRVPANATAARELMLFGVNDSTTYRHAQAIIRNMAAKQVRGTYDPKLAVKAWLHWADGAAKNYSKEFGGKGFGVFTPADRHEAAKQAVDYYAEEIAEARAKIAKKR